MPYTGTVRAGTVGSVPRRPLALVLAGGLVPLVAVLSFSDRAPGLIEDGLARLRIVGWRAERRTGIDLFDVPSLPVGLWFVGHLAMWGLLAFVVTWGLAGRWRPTTIALGLVSVSLLTEVAQVQITTLRAMQASDALANVVGILVGVVLAASASAVAVRLRPA